MSLLPGEFIRPIAGRMPQGRTADGTWIDTLDMTTAPPAAQATVDLHMSVAYWFGYLQGRKEALGEQPGQFQVAAADVVRRMANTPPRDELEELRGNPAGAQRIREQWQRLGLREETP